ncbi:hypothetical protein VUR80DRAFT_2613 [Thermomyces stellatus]
MLFPELALSSVCTAFAVGSSTPAQEWIGNQAIGASASGRRLFASPRHVTGPASGESSCGKAAKEVREPQQGTSSPPPGNPHLRRRPLPSDKLSHSLRLAVFWSDAAVASLAMVSASSMTLPRRQTLSALCSHFPHSLRHPRHTLREYTPLPFPLLPRSLCAGAFLVAEDLARHPAFPAGISPRSRKAAAQREAEELEIG